MSRWDETWDRPHQPGPEALWQESDWLTFFDPTAGVGGIYRIGQQPNREKGQPNLFVFALGGDRFQMSDLGGHGVDVDISQADRWKTGYRVAGHEVEALGGGRMRFRWDYPETAADLEFAASYYEPRNWSKYDRGADIIAWLNADGHLEAAGRLKGALRIDGRDYEVDCHAHRDRSWGYREPYMVKMKRAFGAWGTVGPEFSFAAMRLEIDTGERLITGFVARSGSTDDIVDARWLTTYDVDLVSPVAGALLLTLETGEELQVDCRIAQAHGGFARGLSSNGVGLFDWKGRQGFCDYSASGNPFEAQRGPIAKDVTLLAVDCGLTPSAPASWNLLPPQVSRVSAEGGK